MYDMHTLWYTYSVFKKRNECVSKDTGWNKVTNKPNKLNHKIVVKRTSKQIVLQDVYISNMMTSKHGAFLVLAVWSFVVL